MNRKWQNKIDIAKELSYLIKQYEIRKSKFIKFVPTDKELKHAIELYKFLLEDVEKENASSIKLLKILNDTSENTEEQIKLFGFLDETMTKYPDGAVPREAILDIAEKWDVLDYVLEDMIRILRMRFTEKP